VTKQAYVLLLDTPLLTVAPLTQLQLLVYATPSNLETGLCVS